MSDKQIHLMFLFSLIAIFTSYTIFLNKITTIGVFIDELPFLAILFVVFLISLFYENSLKNYEIIDFQKDSSMGFKNLVIFFLIFQVVDYFIEGGFIAMISLWFSYWIFGYIAFYVLKIINLHKNKKMIKSIK